MLARVEHSSLLIDSNVLVTLAGSNIANEMALFIIEVLKMKMQRVNLGLCFLRLLFGVARVEKGATIETAQFGQVCGEYLLLATELHLGVGGGCGLSVLVDKVEHVHALLAGLCCGLQD
jgi:hypothetical protein